MEVLVEYNKYKRCLIIKCLCNELSKIDSDIELCCCLQFIVKENLYRVQCLSVKFGCFVDVTNAVEEVKDGIACI